MEKKTWKIITICFLTLGLIFTGLGLTNPIKDDITHRVLRVISPSEIKDVDLDINNTLPMSISILDLNSYDIDQVQDQFDAYVKIGQYPGACIAQGVVNSRDDLLGCKVLLKTQGIAGMLFVGIMKTLGDPGKGASYERLGGLIPGMHPTDWMWMSLDFSSDPVDIATGQQFWIVAFSTDNVLDGSYRMWGASSIDPYSQPLKVFDFNTDTWNTVDGIDMCFVTYTPGDEPPPPPPPPPPEEVYLGEAVMCKWINGWQNHGPKVTEFELGEIVHCYLEWQPTTHDFWNEFIGYDWFHNGEIVSWDNWHITEHWHGVWWGLEKSPLPIGNGYVNIYWNDNYLGSSNEYEIFDTSPPPPSQDYERYTTGDTVSVTIRDQYWAAQTFTVGNTGENVKHTINGVNLKIYRTGNPREITVSIYATTYGKPSGSALCSNNYNGNIPTDEDNWEIFAFTLPATLLPDTKYAIVVGTSNGNIAWRCDTDDPAYTGGIRVLSTNSGASWRFPYVEGDLMFEVYGSPPPPLSPPFIDIDITSSIIFGSLGALNLIGAALSFTKYMWFL